MEFAVECPHCKFWIWITEVNCRIFRHAVCIETNEPVNQHASEKELQTINYLGCGKPFRLDDNNNAIVCGWDT